MPLLRDLPSITSAYVAAHVHNPVDWWAWGDDALAEAQRRDVPIFLSIGYAACHWCHVMAHESFEDPAIAELLREGFVAIKVDREERPDVDQVYMAATQLISGHGGWPMSVFLLPDGRPFTAGTYYPPTDRHGMVGFPRLLRTLGEAWRTRRGDITDQADAIQQAMAREVGFIDFLAPRVDGIHLDEIATTVANEIESRTDELGGTGAPRFPRPSYVRALLHAQRFSAAERILTAMARHGLYDHIEGGFARYSVDDQWHVPHFEQMLSDQALLARVYFDAATATSTPLWREVAEATITHVLTHFRVDAGFASSLDADADGHEGSHITWTSDEVTAALREAGCSELLTAALERWRITTPGLFEGRSIPRLTEGAPFLTPPALTPARQALRAARAKRPQPLRDEKVILEWNAMLVGALLASAREDWHAQALALLTGLGASHFRDGHWWRTEQRTTLASCADIAWYIDACLDAWAVAGDDDWLTRATEAYHYLTIYFWDGSLPTSAAPEQGGGFFANNASATDLFIRPKELFDGATPSSHAIATRAIARLAIATSDDEIGCVASRLVTVADELLATHPTAVVDLVAAARFAREGIAVVVPGPPTPLTDHARRVLPDNAVLVVGSGSSPLLTDRRAGWAYVCQGGTCQLPVSTVAQLDEVLRDLRI